MSDTLKNRRVAILATDGVEQVELIEPKKALEEAGAKVEVISPKDGKIKGWDHTDWGKAIPVDVNLKSANPESYDALLLPGGVMNPDHLRMQPSAVQFVRSFFKSGKPVGAICHGPWLLVEADVVRGRKLTSWPSLQTDIRNAGGDWTDQEVVTDQGLVTSRKPADIPAFVKKIIEEIAEGKHAPQHVYASINRREKKPGRSSLPGFFFSDSNQSGRSSRPLYSGSAAAQVHDQAH